MTLRGQQSFFVLLVGQLIEWAYEQGYELTFGECFRTQEQAEWNAQHGTGISNSLHRIRLAIDLNLFRDGVLLGTVEDFRPLGEQWESMSYLARWGGSWAKPDAGHFSLEWQGVK